MDSPPGLSGGVLDSRRRLPCWLSGAQHICLNFTSDIDVPVQLHFALFDGSDGFVLKPPEMRIVKPFYSGSDAEDEKVDGKPVTSSGKISEDNSWPPPRDQLHCTSFHIISLHNLPKRGEHRPSLRGKHTECHKYHPELSGANTPPSKLDPSCPSVALSLHPIGGVPRTFACRCYSSLINVSSCMSQASAR